MRLEIVSFEEGLQKVIQTVLEGRNLPVLISIHGLPNAGKSHLKLTAHKDLRNLGKHGWTGMRGDSLDRFPNFKEHDLSLDYFFIEDMPDVHCVYDYTLAEFGRKPDLCIYVGSNLNSSRVMEALSEDFNRGFYGLIINNPDAKIKPCPY